MAKTYHVFSKLSAGVDYTDYIQGGGDLPTKGAVVHIAGGAGVANKNFITPNGTHTEVTEAQMEVLNRNGIFKLHRDNGYITVEVKKADVDKVVSNMTPASDKSAPLTPNDFEGENGAKLLQLNG